MDEIISRNLRRSGGELLHSFERRRLFLHDAARGIAALYADLLSTNDEGERASDLLRRAFSETLESSKPAVDSENPNEKYLFALEKPLFLLESAELSRELRDLLPSFIGDEYFPAEGNGGEVLTVFSIDSTTARDAAGALLPDAVFEAVVGYEVAVHAAHGRGAFALIHIQLLPSLIDDERFCVASYGDFVLLGCAARLPNNAERARIYFSLSTYDGGLFTAADFYGLSLEFISRRNNITHIIFSGSLSPLLDFLMCLTLTAEGFYFGGIF